MMKPPGDWPPHDPRRGPIALRRELNAIGYNDRAIQKLCQQRVLAKVRWGAYVDGPSYETLDHVGRYALRTRAAMRQAKTAVVASHLSSAVEYDVPTWGLDLRNSHVTRDDGCSGRVAAGVQQHGGRLVDGDVVTRNGIRTMSGTRTALEVTMVASVEPSLAVVNHLLRCGFTTATALAERYAKETASMENWPNSLTTDLVLRLADPRIESLLETRFYFLCFRNSLPMPRPQVEIEDRGRVVARVDFAWPELGVFVEVDGKEKYLKYRRPGESVADAVLREKRREDLVRRLTGWRCIRVTWSDLENPGTLIAMLLRELGRLPAA